MPPPVILPDRLDPMTRAQLAQVVEARGSGTPIRSYRSIEKVCDVSEARAAVLWGLWREVSPFVFERHNPQPPPQDPVAIPVAVTDQQAADEEQDHAAALASVELELEERNQPLALSAATLPPLEEPTHDPIDSAPVREVREPDHDRQCEGVDSHALVARAPDGSPGPAGGQADGLLPGLRDPAGVGRPPRGKGKTVTLDEDQWHGAARTLADIVEAVTQQPARMMDPTAGRGRQLADVGTAIGWSRLRARLDAVVLAARGQPTLPAAVACWRLIKQDGVGRVAMLLRADGANLLRDLDAEVEDLAAGRLTLAKEAPRQVARTAGGRDDGDRSVTADEVRAVLARRGYRQRGEIVGEVADG